MKRSPVPFLRDVECGGDQGTGAWVPDAPHRELSRGALQHYDEMLEDQTGGSSHF